MFTTQRAPKRPADIDLERHDHNITDLFGRSSGDDAARAAGSTAAETAADSDVTMSEESDSDTEAEGKRAICSARTKLSCFISSAPMQMRLRMRMNLSCFRDWSPSEWLLVARGCMHARTAHITASRCSSIVITNIRTQGRSRSSAASVRMLQVILAI